ncbi:MAG: hypothetical protein IPJ39_22045 [Saprospiraceae bacterium]|nr:hypothetical protein [Saprospiraceae bacterium]
MLKVEPILQTANIFTDMGTQVFNTVPTLILVKENPLSVVNLAGRY